MRGRRITVPRNAHWHEVEPKLKPGDYAYVAKMDRWALCAPNGDCGPISPKVHQITEHLDGTITVSPSIQFTVGKRWHGFLERGIWRSV